eukprot:2167682-Rhodomonas_salina.1
MTLGEIALSNSCQYSSSFTLVAPYPTSVPKEKRKRSSIPDLSTETDGSTIPELSTEREGSTYASSVRTHSTRRELSTSTPEVSTPLPSTRVEGLGGRI